METVVVKSNRISYIDLAKGLGIVLIVIGHSVKTGWLREYLYSFHVPFFFLLSGMTYKISSDKKSFWKRKLQTIIVPYFFAGILSILAFSLLGNFASERLGSEIETTDVLPNIIGLLYGNSKTGFMRFNLPLWFLPCLISVIGIVDCFETVLQKFRDKNLYRLGFMLLSLIIGVLLTQTGKHIVLPWHFETAWNMVPFFEGGIIIRKFLDDNKAKYNTVLSNKKILTIIAFGLILVGIILTSINRGANVREDNYHFYPLYFVNAILSGGGYLLFCMALEYNSILEYLGQNTMPILLYHKFPILICQTIIPVMKTWLKSPDSIKGIIAAFITASIAVFLCCLFGDILKRLVPWSIGSVRKEE